MRGLNASPPPSRLEFGFMAATKTSRTRPDEYFVVVIVDGTERKLEVPDLASGEALAEQILSAAERRETLRLVISERDGKGLVPIGAMVIDFAGVTQTVVIVDRRAMVGGSVGIKR